MISVQRGIKLLTETPPSKQTNTVDDLSEADAKCILKLAMRLLRGEDIIS